MLDQPSAEVATPRWRALSSVSPALIDQGLLLGWFVVSRAVLRAIGLQFVLDLRWMFLADPSALKERLAQTIVYFHAFPPGMNLLTGLLLKLDASHLAQWATVVLSASAFVLVGSLQYLGRACGLSRVAALALAAVFALIPPTLYLEHLYLYSIPSASFLCLSAALFHRALCRSSRTAWFLFFAACTALCWVRTTFHLAWFVAVLALSYFSARAPARRTVLWGAAFPAVMLLALYFKNLALFRVFGTTSFGGANLVSVTTRQMPEDERHALVLAGKLSPFADISAFAEPAQYAPLFEGRPRPSFASFPGADDLYRPTVHAGNFNHWYFLVINEQRRKDAFYYLKTHPREYASTVFSKSLPEFFSPTTHWHPHDDREDSPHWHHRQVLGDYENIYNGLVHSFPCSPVGLYVLLPAFFLWGTLRAAYFLRSSEPEARPSAMLLVFCLAQIAYVTVISCLLSYWEASRYRYLIESFIWLIVALGVRQLARSALARFPSLRARFGRSGREAESRMLA